MSSATELTRAGVECVVADAIGAILPGVELDAAAQAKHLKELGADSVDRVEIILTVMDRLRVERPMSTFSAIPNVGALVDYLWETTRS